MRKDLILSPWAIRSPAGQARDDFPESIFFLGNGRMGIRGYLPWDRQGLAVQTGMYLAGIFGEIKPGITDIVNLPTPVWEEVYLDGAPAHLSGPVERELDLRRAVLTLRATLRAGDKEVRAVHTRFFPREETGLCLQRTQFRAESPVKLRVESGLFLQSCNNPVPDDQTKSNDETIRLTAPAGEREVPGGFACALTVAGTGLRVEEELRFRCDAPAGALRRGEEALLLPFERSCGAGEGLTLDKLTFVTTSRDRDPRISPPAEDWTFEGLLAKHVSAWEETWKVCDLPLFKDEPELLCALRFAMLQLFCSCSGRDPSVSIGARGLTHARYKGCYFWDADFFMLPFFLENDREAARNLCAYRVGALPAARDHSQKMNTAGARYPWMAALDGTEQCETWDIGCSELHVTADVVYALDRYCQITGDEGFYLDSAAPVYVETARFWASRYTWRPGSDRADLLFCKGPDEYCGVVNNNLFTNVMVQHNLDLACRAAGDLRSRRPALYEELSLSQEEVHRWAALRRAIPWPRDPDTGRLTTDDTFHLLEPVDLSLLKQGDEASYHAVCFDRLQRYRVVKQADVLLLMTRLPALFTREEKMRAWQDFEPICLHDSTLSFASHALFAAQNGLDREADAYLRKALLLDLRDVMGNTGKEGLHLACMGEAWQAARQQVKP